jgi:hypothetical protein
VYSLCTQTKASVYTYTHTPSSIPTARVFHTSHTQWRYTATVPFCLSMSVCLSPHCERGPFSPPDMVSAVAGQGFLMDKHRRPLDCCKTRLHCGCAMVDHPRHFALTLLVCSFTRARAQGSEFNSGKRERAKAEAHVPLSLDKMVRPPARSVSLVPANDVPARISLAGKVQQRLQLLG